MRTGGTLTRLTRFFISSAAATRIATRSIPTKSGQREMVAISFGNLNPTAEMIRRRVSGLSPKSASSHRRMTCFIFASLWFQRTGSANSGADGRASSRRGAQAQSGQAATADEWRIIRSGAFEKCQSQRDQAFGQRTRPEGPAVAGPLAGFCRWRRPLRYRFLAAAHMRNHSSATDVNCRVAGSLDDAPPGAGRHFGVRQSPLRRFGQDQMRL